MRIHTDLIPQRNKETFHRIERLNRIEVAVDALVLAEGDM
jgi:hypothetical protein